MLPTPLLVRFHRGERKAAGDPRPLPSLEQHFHRSNFFSTAARGQFFFSVSKGWGHYGDNALMRIPFQFESSSTSFFISGLSGRGLCADQVECPLGDRSAAGHRADESRRRHSRGEKHLLHFTILLICLSFLTMLHIYPPSNPRQNLRFFFVKTASKMNSN